MRISHLPRRILQQIGIGSLQYARRTSVKARGMFAKVLAAPAGLDADELHSLVLNELIEDANRIRSAADARDNRSGQSAFGLEDLRARLPSDDLVKIAHHRWVRL